MHFPSPDPWGPRGPLPPSQPPARPLPPSSPLTSNHRRWGPCSLLPSPSAPSPDPFLRPDGSAPKPESLPRPEQGVPCPTAGTARPYPVPRTRSAGRPAPNTSPLHPLLSTPTATRPTSAASRGGLGLLPVRSERTSFCAHRVTCLHRARPSLSFLSLLEQTLHPQPELLQTESV